MILQPILQLSLSYLTLKVDVESLICQQSILLGGVFFQQQVTVDGQPNYFRCPFDSVSGAADCTDSIYFRDYAPAAYRMCRIASRRNRTACHGLANMCALNLYSYLPGRQLNRIDVCQAYDRLYDDDDNLLPWLRYPDDLGDFKSRYLELGINREYLKVCQYIF